MTVPPEDRRFPSALDDQLSYALRITRPLGERAHELLAVYRENRRMAIAKGGLNADFRGIGNGIPAEWFSAIQTLCEAFDELQRYQEDPSRYMASSVYRLTQRINGKKSRRGTVLDYEKIDLVLNAVYRASASVSSVVTWFHARWQKEFDALQLPSDSSIRNRIKEKFTK